MLRPEENDLLTQTGPGTLMGALFRRFWLPALLSSELPEPDCPPLRIRLCSEDLVAFRDTAGRVGIVGAHCPHRGASLFFGRNEDHGLRCVYHGWKYDVNGNCVDMPNEPPVGARHAVPLPAKIHHTAYPTCERSGIVWTYMGPPERMGEPPHLEWARVPESQVVVTKYIASCNYMQAMEGDIDSAHVSFLHKRLEDYGAAANDPTRAPIARYTPSDRAPRFTVKDTDYGLMIGARRSAGADSYYWRISQWLMPAFDMIGHDPDVPMSGHALVPLDDEHVWFWAMRWLGARPFGEDERAEWGGEQGRVAVIPGTWLPRANASNDYLIDREVQRTRTFTGIPEIGEQDLAVTESMGPICDRSQEHLGTTDLAIIAARRRLLAAAQELQQGVEPYPAQHPDVYAIRPTAAILKRDIPFDEDAGVRAALLARA